MAKRFFKILFLLLSVFAFHPVSAQIETDEQLAVQYFQNKEYEKAEVLFDQLFEKNPSIFIYDYYYNCLLAQNNYKKAEKIVRKQIKRNPSILKYQVDLGMIFMRTGDEKKAEKQYESCIDAMQPDEKQILNLASAFLEKKLNEYAIKTYKKGNQILKNPFAFSLQLAEVYSNLGDYQQMIAVYLDLLDAGPAMVTEMQLRLQQLIVGESEKNQTGKLLKDGLLKRIQQKPGKTIYSEMLLWLYVQQKDFESAFLQAKSLDLRFKETGNRLFDLANICISNKNYDVAVKAYEYLISKGKDNFYYLNSRIGLLNVRFYKITNSFDYKKEELLELEKEYLSLLNDYGKNVETIFLIKDLAHLKAFYLNKSDEAINLLNECLQRPANATNLAECKIELADINLMSGDVWEASLLYSQVEKDFKDDPIGHLAKFKNAKLSYYIGEFKWAKAQLDVLKAATSKLIANDAMELSLIIGDVFNKDSIADDLKIFARADLLIFQNHLDDAMKTLDSILKLFPDHALVDRVLFNQAEISIDQGKFFHADSLFQRIADNYPQSILADKALFRLAELNEQQFKNTEKAMKLFEKIITDYPGSLYVVEARKCFRKLRGDNIN